MLKIHIIEIVIAATHSESSLSKRCVFHHSQYVL